MFLPGVNQSSSSMYDGPSAAAGDLAQAAGAFWSGEAKAYLCCCLGNVLPGKNITMVIPKSFRESSFVAVVRQSGNLHLGKPDAWCHTKRVRRDANGLS